MSLTFRKYYATDFPPAHLFAQLKMWIKEGLCE